MVVVAMGGEMIVIVVWRGNRVNGLALRGLAWRGVAWRGVAWRGVAWSGHWGRGTNTAKRSLSVWLGRAELNSSAARNERTSADVA